MLRALLAEAASNNSTQLCNALNLMQHQTLISKVFLQQQQQLLSRVPVISSIVLAWQVYLLLHEQNKADALLPVVQRKMMLAHFCNTLLSRQAAFRD